MKINIPPANISALADAIRESSPSDAPDNVVVRQFLKGVLEQLLADKLRADARRAIIAPSLDITES